MRKGRILRAMEVKRLLSEQLFTPKELRGLSAPEKQLIINNDYHVEFNRKGITYYLFIAKNGLQRKQLYAVTKKQSINPNGLDISKSAYNYRCWLTLNIDTMSFSTAYYEVRGYQSPTIRMIFA